MAYQTCARCLSSVTSDCCNFSRNARSFGVAAAAPVAALLDTSPTADVGENAEFENGADDDSIVDDDEDEDKEEEEEEKGEDKAADCSSDSRSTSFEPSRNLTSPTASKCPSPAAIANGARSEADSKRASFDQSSVADRAAADCGRQRQRVGEWVGYR